MSRRWLLRLSPLLALAVLTGCDYVQTATARLEKIGGELLLSGTVTLKDDPKALPDVSWTSVKIFARDADSNVLDIYERRFASTKDIKIDYEIPLSSSLDDETICVSGDVVQFYIDANDIAGKSQTSALLFTGGVTELCLTVPEPSESTTTTSTSTTRSTTTSSSTSTTLPVFVPPATAPPTTSTTTTSTTTTTTTTTVPSTSSSTLPPGPPDTTPV